MLPSPNPPLDSTALDYTLGLRESVPDCKGSFFFTVDFGYSIEDARKGYRDM